MINKEGDIFRKVVLWSLGLLAYFTVLVVLQAGPLSWMVPVVHAVTSTMTPEALATMLRWLRRRRRPGAHVGARPQGTRA